MVSYIYTTSSYTRILIVLNFFYLFLISSFHFFRPLHDPLGRRELELDSIEVRTAIEPAVAAICEAVHDTLEETPPELAADIMEQGIMLTGGGALIMGLDRRLASETGMPINIAHEPLLSVVIGSGLALENIDALGSVLSQGNDD